MTFNVTVLGTGSALPTVNRYPTAHLLNANERFFLIDCGEGTQLQLRRNRIKLQRIDHIFISHLHGDHYFGLIGLLTSMSLLGREKQINIYSDKQLAPLINYQLNISYSKLNFEILFHTVDESGQLLFSNNDLTVNAVKLNHKIPCFGFLFKEKQDQFKIRPEKIKAYNISLEWIRRIKEGENFKKDDNTIISNEELTFPKEKNRSYAFCSDTKYDEKIVEQIENVDLLYHEATFMENHSERAKKTYHSTARQAALIAKQANAKKLLIGHFSARYKDVTPLLEEARMVFENTFCAKENECYEIT